MKVVVSFYGMCLCVLDQRKGNTAAGATVLLELGPGTVLTGMAKRTIASAVKAAVIAGTITSSPGPTSSTRLWRGL